MFSGSPAIEISARRPPSRSGTRLRSISGTAAAASGTSNQNVAPHPAWLVRPISPPISPASSRQIASPRPVPP